MIAGHFGFAAAVKSKETRVPLWALMIACVFLDLVFVPLFVAGIEPIVPVGKGGYGEAIIHADYTHSLVGALILSIAFGAIFAIFWSRRTALELALVLLGAFLYYRASKSKLVASLLALFGAIVLGLNLAGQ
jgi:hypothetical protein